MREIKKVGIVGAGIMGAGIACHFANIGVEVLLLDIAAPDNHDRNKIVRQKLQETIQRKPFPLYISDFASRISIGNTADNLHKIESCDWIIEAIVEKIEPKIELFTAIEKYRKPDCLVTTNTSGISIEKIASHFSLNFAQHFCGTHFFNPPRYQNLLELIPNSQTSSDVIWFIQHFGETQFGKTVVLAKDTPAFVANRIGTFWMFHSLHTAPKFDFSIPEIDYLTGKILGRPKSATFRTADVVGLDTLALVAEGIRKNTDDEANKWFKIPAFYERMISEKKLGQKSGQGFYKKIKTKDAKKEIRNINLKTFDYQLSGRPQFDFSETINKIPNIKKRVSTLFNLSGEAGKFYRETLCALFWFTANRATEISDSIADIDKAMKSGFAWQLGIFEYWDAIGVQNAIAEMTKLGFDVAPWVNEMLKGENNTFYIVKDCMPRVYEAKTKTYIPISGSENNISLDLLRNKKTIWSNKVISLIDIGDGVLNAEFHSKMNVIGEEILHGLLRAVEIAEQNFKALVISNEGENFSAGADIAMIYNLATSGDKKSVRDVIRLFQKATTQMRTTAIPVVAAIHGLTLGGGCELAMQTDAVVAHAETYTGLVELGVGLIPAGAGTMEMAIRISENSTSENITEIFLNTLKTMFSAKMSASAHEAFRLGFLRKKTDKIVMNRQHLLSIAKAKAISLADNGFMHRELPKKIRISGREGFEAAKALIDNFPKVSDYDKFVAMQLAFILSGGNLEDDNGFVSANQLLNLEQDIFIDLCFQEKTMKKLRHFS